MIFRYNVAGVGCNGTIYKFIVIFICFNQVKMIMRRQPFYVVSCQYDVDNGFRHLLVDVAGNDFVIFFNNFIRDA